VCIKIIKNNKDFVDQSLDEIKLLKYLNSCGDADKYNVLRLHDYFYYKEHLFIVTELLRDNLYEFYKYTKEQGLASYFTLPRLQRIAKQCLVALEFIHGLDMIHTDLKPENILMKSYSKCEVKIIDYGSSCFLQDRLGSYVQSRSYRAPEVILGLPYSTKIDMWSLGCVIAEVFTGKVLFANRNVATLLSRVISVTGPIPTDLLSSGRYTSKYFSKKSFHLYEQDEKTNRYYYLQPKPLSLRDWLKTDDEDFIDFLFKLLAVRPDDRMSATVALQHHWLNKMYNTVID
jgi:serine/threonine protein kinase